MTAPDAAPSAIPGAKQIARDLDANGTIVYAIDGHDLTIVDIWPPHRSADRLQLQVGFGVTGLVARTGKAVLLDEDSPRNQIHRALLGLRPGQTVARMCLPLRGLADNLVGVLAVHRIPPRPFGEHEVTAAQPLAVLLGLRLHAEQLWHAVSRHQGERDRLMKQAISAQESERRRIAFDLHDGVTTALASMTFHLSAANLALGEFAADNQRRVDGLGQVRTELRNARDLADLAYTQTRAAISGLHSLVLDDLGLVAALETLARMAYRDSGPAIDLVVDPQAAAEEIPNHAAAALYRIAQEALNNAVKHAEADRIVLSLRRVGDSVVLGCADDGKGYDPAEQRAVRAQDASGTQHFGISSIAERCAMIEASLRVETFPGRGTTVLVELPL